MLHNIRIALLSWIEGLVEFSDVIEATGLPDVRVALLSWIEGLIELRDLMASCGCYLYVDQTAFGGTLIIRRLGIRWGSHVHFPGQGHHFTRYGHKALFFFL